MVIKGMTPGQVRTLILGSYNAGHWNGATGLDSSTAAAATVGTTGIGYAANSAVGNLTSFKGVTGLSGTDVLVKYTYFGDADLDGDVDGNDVGNWASNFTGSGGSTTKTWDQGDWDYDGDVDGNDVGLWASNFTGSGGGVLNITDAAARCGRDAGSHGLHRRPRTGQPDAVRLSRSGAARTAPPLPLGYRRRAAFGASFGAGAEVVAAEGALAGGGSSLPPSAETQRRGWSPDPFMSLAGNVLGSLIDPAVAPAPRLAQNPMEAATDSSTHLEFSVDLVIPPRYLGN